MQYLIRLDRLKVIEPAARQPGPPARQPPFQLAPGWAGAEVHSPESCCSEFFASAFAGTLEEFFFHGGYGWTDEALTQIKRALRAASRECAEIIERDRTSTQPKNGAAFVLALRPLELQRLRSIRPASPAPPGPK